MNTVESRSEVFWMAFCSLSKKERKAIVERLLEEPEFREDLMDIATFEQRKHEPTEPWETVKKRLGR